MATALGTGILLDATVVRGPLAPPRRRARPLDWWLPGRAARLLRDTSPADHYQAAALPAAATTQARGIADHRAKCHRRDRIHTALIDEGGVDAGA
jgi:hypothetical protein